MMMLDSLGTRYLVDQPAYRSSVAPLNNSHAVLVIRAQLQSNCLVHVLIISLELLLVDDNRVDM